MKNKLVKKKKTMISTKLKKVKKKTWCVKHFIILNLFKRNAIF